MSAFQSLTSRTPNGLTNASQYQTMGNAGLPDPTWAQVFADDFNTYVAANWDITGANPGTPVLADGSGGLLFIENTAGATDATYMQLAVSSFALETGKNVFFKFAGSLSDVANSSFSCGLTQSNAAPLAAANSVGFVKTVGTDLLSFRINAAGVTTLYPLPDTCVLEDNVPFELGFAIDNQGNVAVFWNPGTGSKPANVPNVPVGRVLSLLSPALPLPAINLTPSFGLLNGSAAARALVVDYVVASRDR